MMQHTEQVFTYTAHRAAFLNALATLLALSLVEGGALIFLVAVLVHNLPLKMLLIGGYGTLLAFMLTRLLSPLWTKHSISNEIIHLRYGFAFHVAVPRSLIVDAQTVRERLAGLQVLQASYDQKKRRIVAALSEENQVLLRFDQAQPMKIGRSTKRVKSILINVDERDRFIAAVTVQSATSVDRQSVHEQSVSKAPVKRVDAPLLSVQQQPTPSASGGARAPAIQLEGLTRRFGDAVAVNDLSMMIRPGEIYGFLGSNGAGKTTTMKMLVGLLEPSAGKAKIAGYDVWSQPIEAKTVLGYVADRAILYERLTGSEFLELLAQLRGLAQEDAKRHIAHLLALLELAQDADRLCGSYSFGMKRKLSLAGALLHQPQVLILDEPLNGLDPRSARRVKDLLIELASKGTAILLSTHDLATAEEVCQRVGILHRGRLLAEGSAAALRQLTASADLEEVFLQLTAEQAEGAEV